jgi:hypothetical protein
MPDAMLATTLRQLAPLKVCEIFADRIASMILVQWKFYNLNIVVLDHPQRVLEPTMHLYNYGSIAPSTLVM